MDDNPADTHPSASEVAAPAPARLLGTAWILHHLTHPYSARRYAHTVPVEQLNVTRDLETTSNFEGIGVFRDVWDGVSAADHRELSEPWTGLVRLYELPKMLPHGKMVVRGRETR
eukprot:1411406-Pyramimonas_sp.AAC.1